MQRLLTLRQVPGFEDASLDELAVIAHNVVEQTFAAGTTITTPSRSAPLHLVVEGTLSGAGHTWGAREVVGALEAIARRRTREPIVAKTAARTLRLAAADFREILDGNYGLMSSVRRALARELLSDLTPPPPVRLQVQDVTSAPPLGMVDRLIVLRRYMPFSRGRIEALAALAQASEEVRLPARSLVGRHGDAAASVLFLLDGTVHGIRDGVSFVLGPGHAPGVLESLAEVPYASSMSTLTPIRALRFPNSALFDVLEDHTDLALAMVESLASALVDRNRAEQDRVN
ncbi:MAG: cyclic nucleotide-binding domain-containing protein [Kofleriaceae bacterium]